MLLLCAAALQGHTSPGRPAEAPTSASAVGVVTVHAQSLAEIFPAYGEVRPIAPLPVSASEPGVVTHLRVVPGSKVRAGEALATLTGPEILSLLTLREAAVRSARAQLAAAGRSLTIERQQLSAQLSTQQAVAAAQSAVAAAQAAFDSAQSNLKLAQEMRTLRASSAGTVLSVSAADGQRVMPGQTLLVLQADDRLWLTAAYYGADAAAIHVGMAGSFQPAAGGIAVPVKVVMLSAALAPDGGELVGLDAVDARGALAGTAVPPWLNGERGTVTLAGPAHRGMAVPTRALILDRARWWVLVRTPHGLRPRAVVPGPARGWETFIVHGLSPGEQVVVQNAYLEYHRDIAQRYAPPD